MLKLADNNNISLSREEAYKLFNKSIIELKNEIAALKDQISKFSEKANLSANNPDDVDTDSRKEYNEEARKVVKNKLEKEGFYFENGIGNGTCVEGVRDPEGKPVKLVVKSCRGGKLYLNPGEWGEVLYPNAMLWIYDGHEASPLKLRDLICNQDKLVLTMDTRNLDDVNRVSRFAQVLRYFKQINFEFDSVQPSTIASTYKEYAFDDRPKDEELTPDDFKDFG